MKLKRIPMVYMAVAALAGAGVSYLILKQGSSPGGTQSRVAARTAAPPKNCAYIFSHVDGYQRIRPLFSSEPLCESPRFEGLRSSIGSMVQGMKAEGKVVSASVYLRDFQKGEWTWYNGDEPYDPGSMLKVPLLLTYLAMAEEDPGLLKRTWTCEKMDVDAPQHTAFPAPQLQGNKSYTIGQILEYMTVHSDNRATVMLLRHVAKDRYIKTFTDLGLPAPDWDGPSYRMNVRDYSVFMKALYSSSMLSPINSEYALDMMTRASFNKGLVAGIPDDVEVAHKFGEAGDPMERQLHETGLVYAQGDPYLITIMTRGANPDSLASAIASISHLVYEGMKSR